jgi:hypothetical protein
MKKGQKWNNTTRLDSGYRGLANAIVYKAARDYKSALKKKGAKAEWEVESCRRFFLGDWFKTICTIDGGYLMREIEKEAKAEMAKKNKKARK